MLSTQLFRHSDDLLDFGAGDVVFLEGQAASHMYVVVEGELEVYLQGQLIEVAGPNAILGEISLLDGSPRSATVRAKTPCKLAAIDQKRFLFLVQQNPHFALHVMRAMAERLRRH
jgi:CRP-like cAMP-binding protein